MGETGKRKKMLNLEFVSERFESTVRSSTAMGYYGEGASNGRERGLEELNLGY